MLRRWIFYLAINILVSAATMLTVLALWERSNVSLPISAASPTPSPLGLAISTPTTNRPSSTPHIYIVKDGDTLGAIAAQFGVDPVELARINNITDPDSLPVGMSLIIPPSAESTPNTSLTSPTVTPKVGEAFPWPVLEEVQFAGDPAQEVIILINRGPTYKLDGWKLESPAGQTYIFGEFTLATGGEVRIHTAAGKDTSLDLYWGLTDSIWKSGDTVLLSDADGNLRSMLVIS